MLDEVVLGDNCRKKMESVLLGFLLGEEDRGKSEGSKLNLWQIGVYLYLGELKNVKFPLYTCIAFYKLWLLFVLVKTDNTRTQA